MIPEKLYPEFLIKNSPKSSVQRAPVVLQYDISISLYFEVHLTRWTPLQQVVLVKCNDVRDRF